MHWVEKPGTSLEAMRRITVNAGRELMDVDGVRNFGAHIGRAEVADEVVGVNFTELWISLDPAVDYDVEGGPDPVRRRRLSRPDARPADLPAGADQGSADRRQRHDRRAHLRSEPGAAGGDRRRGRQALGTVDGVADLTVQQLTVVPQVEVRMRPEAAQIAGVTPGQVRDSMATLLRGTKVGEIYEDQKIFDTVVWSVPAVRSDLFAIKRLPIDTGSGGYVPLEAVADVTLAPTPNEITREGGSRRIDVTTNVRDRDLGAVARDIQAALGSVTFPEGYHAEVLGEYAAREASQNRLLALGFLSLLGILLVLHVDFGSARLVAMVALTLPFALIGGVAAAFLSGGVLSLGSLVGFVTVLGIAARNGIMLVSHYRHLEDVEGVPFGPELVERGAEERLAPILMTALATGLALVPIVVGGSRSGQEVEHPMAVVILGGLFTSTVLNLFLLPALYFDMGAALQGTFSMRILLVEEEPRAAQILAKGLREEAYAVDIAPDGEQAVYDASISEFDAVILDIGLPRQDGFAVCRQLRNAGLEIPILMLTARDAIEARVQGLDSGADDYLTKPFDFRELLARLRALLRRGHRPVTPAVLTVGPLTLDTRARRVRRNGRLLELTAREYSLLEYLALHTNAVVGRAALTEHVWEAHTSRPRMPSTSACSDCAGRSIATGSRRSS